MEGEDRISNLPLFILHRILGRVNHGTFGLPQQLRLLSKKWRSILTSFPVFIFHLDRHGDAAYNEFVNLVDNSLNTFIGDNLLIDVFDLHCLCPDPDWASQHVDRWIESVLCNGVSTLYLTISTEPSNGEDFPEEHYILPKTTFIPKFAGSGYSTLHFLEHLFLGSMCISESIIQDIIHNCPNLQDLSFWLFSGLKTLRIFNLDKLTSLFVVVDNAAHELKSVLVDAPNLINFRFTSSEDNLPVEIEFVSSPHLQSLYLEKCAFRDDEFNSLLSSCPNIESMEVVDCRNLYKFGICMQRLKSLRLVRCNGIDIIDIDAPNMSSFIFDTHVVPSIFSKRIVCPITISYSMVENRNGEVVNSWFLNLRKLLDASKEIKELKLFVYDSEVKFNLDNFEEAEIPQKIVVDHLKVSLCGLEMSMNHSGFIDALLWTCHPKKISVNGESNFEKSWIENLCTKLLERMPVCCSDSPIKCWRHDLKTAKILKFGSIEDEEQLLDWRTLSNTLSSFTRYDQVSFYLEWRFC